MLKPMNSVCRNPDRFGDVIFVHGLNGHFRDTWCPNDNNGNEFWFDWISEDHPDIGIWSFNYQAGRFALVGGSSMSISQQAGNLLAWLKQPDRLNKPLIFVAYSLGGLIVKQMLKIEKESSFSRKNLFEQVKGIVFLATPHQGAFLANYADNLSRFLRTTTIVRELRANSQTLLDLDEWYRNNVCNLKIKTLVYFETQPLNGSVVVDENSSDPNIPGVTPIAIHKNHRDIAKPSRNDLIDSGVRDFIHERLKTHIIINCVKPKGFTAVEYTAESIWDCVVNAIIPDAKFEVIPVCTLDYSDSSDNSIDLIWNQPTLIPVYPNIEYTITFEFKPFIHSIFRSNRTWGRKQETFSVNPGLHKLIEYTPNSMFPNLPGTLTIN